MPDVWANLCPLTYAENMPLAPLPNDPKCAPMPDVSTELVEHIARGLHNLWMKREIAEGWSYGPPNVDGKTEPSLLPYDLLDEQDRDTVRQTAIMTLKILSFFGILIDRHPVTDPGNRTAITNVPDEFREVAEKIARNQHTLECSSEQICEKMSGRKRRNLYAARILVPFDELSEKDKQKYRGYADHTIMEAINLGIGIHPPKKAS